MRALRSFLALSLVAAVAAAPAAGQVSLGVAGLFASLNGSDFDGTDAGFGGDAQVMFRAGQSITVGGGVQFTSHGTNYTDGNLSVLGIFLEPRYHITMSGGGALRPYLAARLAYMRESATVLGLDGHANGWEFGGGAGLLYSLGPTIELDLTALFESVSFGDAEVDGSTIPDSNTSGSALAIRGGLKIRLGGGGQ